MIYLREFQENCKDTILLPNISKKTNVSVYTNRFSYFIL